MKRRQQIKEEKKKKKRLCGRTGNIKEEVMKVTEEEKWIKETVEVQIKSKVQNIKITAEYCVSRRSLSVQFIRYSSSNCFTLQDVVLYHTDMKCF